MVDEELSLTNVDSLSFFNVTVDPVEIRVDQFSSKRFLKGFHIEVFLDNDKGQFVLSICQFEKKGLYE